MLVIWVELVWVQKCITNAALRLLDGVERLPILDRDLAARTCGAADFDRFIVANGGGGDCAG